MDKIEMRHRVLSTAAVSETEVIGMQRDDSVVILVGNDSFELTQGTDQLQEIIQSYRQFCEMTSVEEDVELAIEQPVDFM